MTKKGAILDVDFTIIDLKDYLRTINRIYRETLEEVSTKDLSDKSDYDLFKLVLSPNQECVKKLFDLGIMNPKCMWKILEQKDMKERARAFLNKDISVYPDAIEFMENFDGKIGFLSNTPEKIIKSMFDFFDINFDHRYTRCYTYNTHDSKPNPIGIYEIAEEMDLPLDSVFMVGDSSTDINTAKAAGVDSYLVKRNGNFRYNGPESDHVINSLTEILEINSR